MKKRRLYPLIVLLIISLLSVQASATWYSGHLHQHTGYSTGYGYDRNQATAHDDCIPRELEGHSEGRTVEVLAGQAILQGLGWFGLSDHSYCTNTSEFDIVEQDCNTADVPLGFTCLMGEELSVSDNLFDNEVLTSCWDPLYGEAHEGAYGINSFIQQSPNASHCPSSPTGQEGINQINNQGGLSILNHPHPTSLISPFLDFESVFDMNSYDGIEIWNGDWDISYFNHDPDNFETWRTILLRGDHVYAYGGSDSHDDIIPVGRGNENYVLTNGAFTQNSLQNALKNGTVTVSNNGLAFLEAHGQRQNHWTMQGNTTKICSGENIILRVNYSDVSTSCTPRVYKGRITQPAQPSEDSGDIVFPIISGTASGTLTTRENPGVTQNAYYRAECINDDSRIYTNPVWIEIDNTFSDADSICDASDCRPNDRYIFPGNSNSNCDCDASDGISVGTTEALGDGADNDCDGAVDEGTGGSDPACINNQTRLCPNQFGVCSGARQTCSAGDWSNCNYASWSANYQAVESLCDTLDNDCNTEVDEARDCRSPDCGRDESLVACRIRPTVDSLAQIYYDFDPEINDAEAEDLDSNDLGLILGETEGGNIRWWVPERFEITGSRSTCPSDVMDYLNGGMERNQARLLWRNDGPNSCDVSRIYRNEFDEALLVSPAANEATLGSDSNWANIHSINAECDVDSDVEETIEQDLDDDFVTYGRSDQIALAFWPTPGQDSWTINEVGNDVSLELDICKPCTDADGDGFNSATSCGTSNDCRDSGANAANIFPNNVNTYCDCASPFPDGRTETCDETDDDCDGTVDEGCDDDADGVSDISITGGTDCNDANANMRPGLAEDCADGLDNDCDSFIDCADAQCTQGSRSASGFCCGSGCNVNGGSCADASVAALTCSDASCNTFGEFCQNGELEGAIACSGTSLACSGGTCEFSYGAPSSCDEITAGDTVCENSAGVNDEKACEATGTNCYVEADFSCSAPSGCDELAQDACSTNTSMQCEWQGTSTDDVVEECESDCSAPIQCDEQLPGANITICGAAGLTYFADSCSSSSCSLQDRTDNVCRSSSYNASCTADSLCNGVVAGSNNCNASCTYVPSLCGNISVSITLNQSVTSNSTCFLITADDVTINCAGHTVTYGTNTSPSAFAVYATERDNVTIRNCVMVDSASNQNAIQFVTVTNSLVENNTIMTGSAFSNGISLSTSSVNNTFRDNRITTTGSNAARGIVIGSNNNNIINNNITTYFTSSHGVLIDSNVGGTMLINNNISVAHSTAFNIHDLSGASTVNYLVYNNSLGEIKWLDNGTGSFPRNLTLKVDSAGLGLGRTITIGQNLTAVNTSAFTVGLINSSANITMRGLPFSTITAIIKDPAYRTNPVDVTGSDCIAGGTCVNIGYTGGILVFNTTSFSSFAARGS